VVAFLKGENGAETFGNILAQEQNILAIHAVNLCEIYYNYLRDDGSDVAEEAWRQVTRVASVVERLDEAFVRRVGRWKGLEGLGLGDAFAAATAEEFGVPLIATDHDDFEPVEAKGLLNVLWLRPRV
jgi:predicted nucleic acid-binding protein